MTDSKRDSVSASQKQSSRYYKVDDGCDKRVYENTPGNIVRIIATLLFFYLFQCLHWWAVFVFGIYMPWEQTIYQIIVFCCTIFTGILMLISGKFANKKKRYHDFLLERLSEKKSAKEEEENRRIQEEAYEKRLKQKHQE